MKPTAAPSHFPFPGHRTMASVMHSERKARAYVMAGLTPDQRLDMFAELIADDMHPEEAGFHLGYSRSYGRTMMAKLRRKMEFEA